MARSILEDKLLTAGADRVMSPYVMGGRRMAAAVLRPHILDFLELAMHTDGIDMMTEEHCCRECTCSLKNFRNQGSNWK